MKSSLTLSQQCAFRWALLFSIVLSFHHARAAEVSGTVSDASGTLLANAQVYAEPGVGGALLQTTTSPSGDYAFENLPPGPVGFFAVAPGMGFGGIHQNLTVGEARTDLNIRLRSAARVRAKVVDDKGEPISGAIITRIGILGDDKVGIPLSKLQADGHVLPVSDENGFLEIDKLPSGLSVAIKVGHALYAQEGVDNVPVGTEDLRISLYRGVLVQGDVQSKAERRPVANATVVIRNAQPPHDTALTETNGQGIFSIRLKPGVYLYRAAGAASQSAGWQQLRVTGEVAQAKAHLVIAGTGTITGEVRDALTQAPIAGARMSLETNGNAAAVVRTGPTGRYAFEATEGQNVVRLESAPGYQRNQEDGVKLMIAAGDREELPGMWLAPLRPYTLRVIDGDGQAVQGATVSILRPYQFGTTLTDQQGQISIAVNNVPADGQVVGTVQYLDAQGARMGALFSLDKSATGGASVQLLPLAAIHGVVQSDEGNPLAGVVVGGVFPGREESEEPLLLWRCVTREDGTFSYGAIVPRVPQQCLARDAAGARGLGMRFNADDGGKVEVGAVVVSGGVTGRSMLGEKVDADDNPLICPGPTTPTDKKLWVFTPSDRVASILDSLQRLRAQGLSHTVVVVVDGAYNCADTAFTWRTGKPPGTATSLITSADDTVEFETVGLPELFELKK